MITDPDEILRRRLECDPLLGSQIPERSDWAPVPSRETAPPTDYSQISDEVLDATMDRVLADFGLAVKYEHNHHLLPAIRAQFDKLNAERKRRAGVSERAEPDPQKMREIL